MPWLPQVLGIRLGITSSLFGKPGRGYWIIWGMEGHGSMALYFKKRVSLYKTKPLMMWAHQTLEMTSPAVFIISSLLDVYQNSVLLLFDSLKAKGYNVAQIHFGLMNLYFLIVRKYQSLETIQIWAKLRQCLYQQDWSNVEFAYSKNLVVKIPTSAS